MNAILASATLLLFPLVATDGPALDSGHVRLSVDAYEKLKAAAAAATDTDDEDEMDEEGDADASAPRLLDGLIRGTLDRKRLHVELSGTVEGVAGRWNVVPLVPSRVAITAVELQGGPATLVAQEGMTALVFEGAGRRSFRVSLDATGGGESGSARAVELALLPGHSRRFVLDLLGKVDPEVSPDALLAAERSAGRRTIQGWVPASADTISVRWDTDAVAEETVAEAPREEPKSKEPARLNVQASILASVGERLLTTYATLRYAIFHAPVSRFEFSVPAGATVLGVQGRGVSTWTCGGADKAGSTCSVELPFPVQRTYELSIQLEQPLPRDMRVVDVAVPQALGVQRQGGHVAIEVMGNAEVKPADGVTATREDVRELPADLFTGQSTPILLAFKYLEMPTRVVLDIQRRESVETSPISVETADFTTVWTTEGRTITEATFHVRNRQRQFLALALPPEAVIQSAFVADAPVKPSTGDDGRIRIPLRNQGQSSSDEVFVVQVVYIRDRLPLAALGAVEAALPSLDAEVGAIKHTLILPDHQKLWSFGGDLSIESPRIVHEAAVHHGRSPFLLGAAANNAMDIAPAQMAMPEAEMLEKLAPRSPRQDRARKQAISNLGMRGTGAGGGGLMTPMEESAFEDQAAPVGNTGVLPVRIQIPQSGDRYIAHAFYVPANASLAWRARVASPAVTWAASMLALLVGLLLGVLAWRDRAALLRRGTPTAAHARLALLVVTAAFLAFVFRRHVEVFPLGALAGFAGAWLNTFIRARMQAAAPTVTPEPRPAA